MKAAIAFVLSLLMLSSIAVQGKDAPKLDAKPTFRIYLIDGEIDRTAKDQQEKLADFKLVKEPILTEKDLRSYDWKNHALEVTDEAIERLEKMIVHGKPDGGDVTPKEVMIESMKSKGFVVVVNGKRAYAGAFLSPVSSMLPALPVIYTGLWTPPEGGKGKAILTSSGMVPEGQKDPRGQEWIKDALKDMGKLKPEQDNAAD